MASFSAEIIHVVTETIKITLLVFVMMVAVDLLNIWTRGRIKLFLQSGSRFTQYLTASSIGALPGCFGAFTNVSLYVHGLISLGALTGAMAAASGDEAFVMLAMFPKTAVLLILALFFLGVIIGWFTDKLIRRIRYKPCEDCKEQIIHPQTHGLRHYVAVHVWQHIIRKHLWKTALWTFGAMLMVGFGIKCFHLDSFSTQYPLILLIIAGLMGLIPESGPHMIFITLFASGLIPFSVLFTSAFVQDGHGMLPLLSFSVKDSIFLKAVNLGSGLLIGLILFTFGF